MSVAVIEPVLLPGVYHTGTIVEGPLPFFCVIFNSSRPLYFPAGSVVPAVV